MAQSPAPARTARAVFSEAIRDVGINLLENEALSIAKDGRRFWLLGLGDQLAFPLGHHRFKGVDDLPRTLAGITDDAPAILLAHEPDIFANEPASRVALTLSGHTHGGQIRLFGWSPIVPSEFGHRFAYGHIEEAGRHLIVTGGLGTSIVPIRFGVPPEIVFISARPWRNGSLKQPPRPRPLSLDRRPWLSGRTRFIEGPITSMLRMRMQPDDTAWPIVSGSLVPWMR